MENQETTENQQSGGAGEAAPHDEGMSMEELLKSESELSGKLYGKEIVQVKVVQVTPEAVLVDIGEKKEGMIPAAEFSEAGETPKVGDTVSAVLLKKGWEGKHAALSHRMARERLAWDEVKKLYEAKERVKGRVAEQIRGGYIVDISGVRAFMPLSLSELGGAHRHYLPQNAKIKFYITDLNEKDRKLVVSRRQVLEEDEKERKTEVLGEISAGGIVRAVVSKVTPEGVSLRFQGIEGFVKMQDVAWKNPEEAAKTLKRGQRVKCKILSVDREKERLALGLKQLVANPVDMLRKRFPFKSMVRVTVLSVAKEGAKVKISDHVSGFIPAEEYGADGEPKAGAEMKAVVQGVNASTFELNLSARRFEEFEDRKRVQQYMKGTPTLTLGQILLENSEEEGEV